MKEEITPDKAMEKKTAELLELIKQSDRDVNGYLETVTVAQFISDVLNVEEYSSLQSEEKDKEIERLREALIENKDVLQWHLSFSGPRSEVGQGDFFNLTAHAITQAEQALSNQPIESDNIMKEEKQNGYAPINITQVEEIEAKDRRIKEKRL